ncbi:hypothetical protein [Sorangium sp. So ce861]|uniref:hypothetical protein n=1 Tax=Sorangium sp. So ce861 TaxID=3133323 RepID=UPI003F6486E2
MALLTTLARAWGCAPAARAAPVSCALALSLLSAAPGARADLPDPSAAQDEVLLKHGGMLRGTVIETEPGKHVVVIVYGTNEERIVPWDDVERVEPGKHTVRARRPERRPNADEPARPGFVRVRIVSLDPEAPVVGLYRWLGNTAWLSPGDKTSAHDNGTFSTGSQEYGPALGAFECRAPCDLDVDGSRGHEFVLSGEGIVDSRPFNLLDWSAPVTLRVNPGSFTAHRWGSRMRQWTTFVPPLIVGAALSTAGMLTAEHPQPFNLELLVTGLAIASLAGFIPMTGSILMLANRTTYTVTLSEPATALAPRLGPGGLVWRF